ncbi:MAG: hypothetical protein GY863_00485 [bacterium]|nr:hypothetical protein [bacterium]
MEEVFQQTYTPKVRNKKPAKTSGLHRDSDEWKKLMEEAKRKEIFWTKGFLPSSLEAVKTSQEYSEDEEDNIL